MVAFGRVTPFDDPRQRFRAGRFGMVLFLASLAMLFVASIVGFIVLRIVSGERWPADLPPLPRTLWLSTLTLAVSSATLQGGLVAIRRGGRGWLAAAMPATLGLGVLFLALQAVSWMIWLADLGGFDDASEAARFGFSGFYVLTAVHALHVVGGLVPMTIVTWRAWRGRYGAERHWGVHYVAMYWHFLGVVWVALFATLLIGL